MGPIATGLGEIFMFTVEPNGSARKIPTAAIHGTDLRTIQDWIVRPQLSKVPGVTEVNSVGGHSGNIWLRPISGQADELCVDLPDIINALEQNNTNVGAGYIEGPERST